jgi:hypothetical protein
MVRAYPFSLHRAEGREDSILCIDEDSKLIVEGEGEDFFDDKGIVSLALKDILTFVSEVDRSRKTAQVAVDALASAGVILPWPIPLNAAQGNRVIAGLHRIDEGSLSALADDVFLKLRHSGALSIAYAQLLSMGQVVVLTRLAELHAQMTPKPIAPLPDSLDQIFGFGNDETLRFH